MASWRFNKSGQLTGYTLSQRDVDARAAGLAAYFLFAPIFYPAYWLHKRLMELGYPPGQALFIPGIPCIIILLGIIFVPMIRYIYFTALFGAVALFAYSIYVQNYPNNTQVTPTEQVNPAQAQGY